MDEKEFATQTQLGKLFSVSDHKIGKWLDELDLRYRIAGTSYPTAKAVDQGLVKWMPLEFGGGFYMWELQKTAAVLRQAGHRTITDDVEAMLAEFRDSKT